MTRDPDFARDDGLTGDPRAGWKTRQGSRKIVAVERLQALIDAGVLPANHQLGRDELDAIASLSEQELEQLVRSPSGQPVEPSGPTFAVSI